MKNIVLIGMMGSGKTTIAKYLSQVLCIDYIDMDEYIENKYKMSISDMFNISEAYFREREVQVCYELSLKDNIILSTGGGVIKNESNISLLKNNGIIIYIDRPVDSIYKDIDITNRPLLKENKDILYDLYNQRHDIYLKACDYHLINDSTLEDIIEKIVKLLSM